MSEERHRKAEQRDDPTGHHQDQRGGGELFVFVHPTGSGAVAVVFPYKTRLVYQRTEDDRTGNRTYVRMAKKKQGQSKNKNKK